MPDTFELAFTYARDEFIRAFRGYYGRNISVGRGTAAGLILIVAGALLLMLQLSALAPLPTMFVVFAWTLSAAGGICLATVFLIHFYLPKYAFDSNPKLRNEIQLGISEEELHFRTADLESRIAWTWYRGWRYHPEFYILLDGSSHINVVPRRAFTTSTDDARFAAFLERKLGPATNS